jgi:phosphatidylglycerophosphatase C
LRLEHEIALLDVAAGINFLRDSGFKRIILGGNSGGASLYAFYNEQSLLEPARRLERTPGGRPTGLAKARLLHLTLSGRTLAEMEDWTARWLARDFPGQLQDWTLARLAWHREAGHCCVLVSASPDIYLQRVARELGFDGLICTEMQVQDARLTGRLQTPNCHGEQKVLRLKAWLSERFGADFTEAMTLYAYGDTAGDKPMLRLATQAWYRGQPWSG